MNLEDCPKQAQDPLLNVATGGLAGADEETETPNHGSPTTTRLVSPPWSRIQKYVHSGDVLLQSSFPSRGDSPTISTCSYDRRLEFSDRRLRREEALESIRSKMSFSLTQCLMAILCYIAIAVIAYTFVLEDQWTVIDSIYFSVVSFTSVGYGDLVPSTRSSRIFTSLFTLSSIACLGFAIGVVGNQFIEAQRKAFEHAKSLSERNVIHLFSSSTSSQKPSGAMAIVEAVVETKNNLKQEQPVWMHIAREFIMVALMLSLFAVLLVTFDPSINLDNVTYFLIITSTTCGFGDVTPTSQQGRLATALFIPLAVGAMGRWLSIVASSIIESRQNQYRQFMETKHLTQEDLEVMDEDGDGDVTWAEFLEFMLVAMDKVDRSLIDELRSQFSKLDVDGTGILSKGDLVAIARKKLKNPMYKLELEIYKEQLLQKARASSVNEDNGHIA